MPNLYDKLLLILEKINYSQDKEQFAGKFVLNVYMIVLLSLADTLDDANKSTFLNELTQKSTNGENPRDLLLQHFTGLHLRKHESPENS